MAEVAAAPILQERLPHTPFKCLGVCKSASGRGNEWLIKWTSPHDTSATWELESDIMMCFPKFASYRQGVSSGGGGMGGDDC